MRKLLLLALLPIAGCANPYDTSHLSEAERAAAIGAILSRPQQPAYQMPAYQMPVQRTTNCRRMSNGDMNCTTW